MNILKTILGFISDVRNLKQMVQWGVIGLIVWGVFFKKDHTVEEMKEYWEHADFRTDSIQVQVDYSKLPKPEFKYEVPPAQVKNYFSTDSVIINNTHVVSNDSLLTVIDSLRDEITHVSLDFLKLHPTASKLLYGTFSGDSLRLDMLDITGGTFSLIYGVNYDRFKYQWIDGQLKADPIPRVGVNKKFSTATYGYLGYSTLMDNTMVGADYSIFWRRWRIRADLAGSLETTPQWKIEGNLGFKIK